MGFTLFEPSASDIAAIYDADIFVYHSRTLESWAGGLDPNLQKSKVKVLEASEGMTLERVPGLEDVEADEGVDEKTLYDPHTWLDPEKAAEEATLIAKRLSEVDPKHRDVYKRTPRPLLKKRMRSHKSIGVYLLKPVKRPLSRSIRPFPTWPNGLGSSSWGSQGSLQSKNRVPSS